MAPRIFIFSIVLGAKYLSYVKFIATFALNFFGYIISGLASVSRVGTVETSHLEKYVETAISAVSLTK